MTEIQLLLIAFGAGGLGGYVAARIDGAWNARIPNARGGKGAPASQRLAEGPHQAVAVANAVAGASGGAKAAVEVGDAMAHQLTRALTLRVGGRQVVTTAEYLRRFLAMPAITRGEWTGDKDMYGELRAVALAEGWAVWKNGRDVDWSPGWRSLRVRAEEFQLRYRVKLVG